MKHFSTPKARDQTTKKRGASASKCSPDSQLSQQQLAHRLKQLQRVFKINEKLQTQNDLLRQRNKAFQGLLLKLDSKFLVQRQASSSSHVSQCLTAWAKCQYQGQDSKFYYQRKIRDLTAYVNQQSIQIQWARTRLIEQQTQKKQLKRRMEELEGRVDSLMQDRSALREELGRVLGAGQIRRGQEGRRGGEPG